MVYVDSCKNLSKLGNSHPYWKLRIAVGKSVRLSQSVQMSSHPIFCERFVFLVESPDKDCLTLDFFNMKNDKSGGSFRIRISEIWRDHLTLSKLLTRELVTKSPTGQRKDPKLIFSCEFKKLLHTSEIVHKLNFALPSRQSLKKVWKKAEQRIFEPKDQNVRLEDPLLSEGRRESKVIHLKNSEVR